MTSAISPPEEAFLVPNPNEQLSRAVVASQHRQRTFYRVNFQASSEGI
ncbi:MAG TPA: hypothetical protein VNG70_13105 [Candidatus Limnocylindria bacterium]|jgi:hypothetical protein|nr:hypothetical protein [Candidatus Limnocylindria bacterium]